MDGQPWCVVYHTHRPNALPLSLSPFPFPYLAHGVERAQHQVVEVAVAQQRRRVRPQRVLEGSPHPVQFLARELFVLICDL